MTDLNRAPQMAADVVLVGAGHAHLLVALQAQRFRSAGHSVAIVDPGDFWYSGMATGLLGGRYRADEDRIEVAPFADACGLLPIRDKVIGLDRTRRLLKLAGGGRLSFRVASFNIGSEVDRPFPVEDQDGLWHAKPIHRLPALRDRLCEDWRSGRRVRFLVVGGGPTGCELACNLIGLARRVGGRLDLILLENGPRVLPRQRKGVSDIMHHFLVKQGAAVRLNSSVARLPNGRAVLDDGESLAFDHALLATGLVANRDTAALGLRTDARRGLVVNERLCSVDDPYLFAAGDCADIQGHDLPRLGVFGVRAAPILTHNLLAQLSGSKLKRYRPQTIWFSAQNLGDGTGLATWGPLWWHGRTALGAKEWLDHRFMAQFHAVYRSSVQISSGTPAKSR